MGLTELERGYIRPVGFSGIKGFSVIFPGAPLVEAVFLTCGKRASSDFGSAGVGSNGPAPWVHTGCLMQGVAHAAHAQIPTLVS